MTLVAALACSSSQHGGPRAVRDTDAGTRQDGGGAPPEDGGAGSDAGNLPWKNRPFPAVLDPSDNPSSPEKVALGRLLFYDPVVSQDHQVACATCHSEVWGMSDGLPRSVGHGAGLVAGPGRTGPNMTRRNAPTLWNVAFRESEFWDGRATSLEDQVRFPFDTHEEFDTSFADTVAEVVAIPAYAALFRTAFPDDAAPGTQENFARAIAAFERSLISHDGLYDSYVNGDPGALTPDMLHGMALFGSEGCASCHTPPLFSGEGFFDRGVSSVPGIEDQGRYEVTLEDADRNTFKVPTLRNAHDTGPYFHTGAVSDFTDAVRQEVTFSVAHDGAQALSGSDIDDLATFLMKGLFDTQDSPTRPREVPSGLPVPLDGFSILR